MNIWQSVAGMVTAELTSACPYERIKELNRRGISIYDLKRNGELSLVFRLRRKDLPCISVLAERHSERLRVISHDGIFWTIQSFFARTAMVIGLCLLLLLVCILPTRVLFMRVEGNESIPENLILEAAEDCGIRFGASRSAVRSEKVKNGILSRISELQWVGVNTKGCIAVISVQERSKKEAANYSPQISNIVAERDGVILSCTVTQGSGACTAGQAVQKGQILISGLTDCGIASIGTRAAGEVMAQTSRQITAVAPEGALLRTAQAREIRRYSIRIQKKRINLYKGSGIYPPGCDKMYTEHYLTLPGGFRLPVCLMVETIKYYEISPQTIAPDERFEMLRSYSEDYLRGHMIAGTIASRHENPEHSDGAFRLKVQFNCTEMIGREESEGIGDLHSETN